MKAVVSSEGNGPAGKTWNDVSKSTPSLPAAEITVGNPSPSISSKLSHVEDKEPARRVNLHTEDNTKRMTARRLGFFLTKITSDLYSIIEHLMAEGDSHNRNTTELQGA
ncbi:hypothetical protein PZA11_002509 [Diplocarpon coronariae]